MDEFNSKDEFIQFIIDANIPLENSGDTFDFMIDNLWDAKMGRFTRTGMKKLWLEKDKFNVIAYQDEEGQKFTDEFISFLEKIEPLRTGGIPLFEKKTKPQEEKKPLSKLDEILDKINISGIDSLTNEEKVFLGNQ
jgi:hypothetical protein